MLTGHIRKKVAINKAYGHLTSYILHVRRTRKRKIISEFVGKPVGKNPVGILNRINVPTTQA